MDDQEKKQMTYEEWEKLTIDNPEFMAKYTRVKSEEVNPLNYKEIALVVSTFLQEKKESIKASADRREKARKAWNDELATWPKRSKDALVELTRQADEGHAAGEQLKSDAVQVIAFQSATNRNFSKALDKAYARPDLIAAQVRTAILQLSDTLDSANKQMGKLASQFKLEKKKEG